MNDLISRQAAIDVASGYCHPANIADELRKLPSAQPQTEWNNHTVACLLAELFGDTCACNYNGIDEWLPEKCEVIDACPNPAGVACWEQFLKHREMMEAWQVWRSQTGYICGTGPQERNGGDDR